MKKTKIAIACQGGGSQTAFTAGVFKAFFENDVQNKVDIVGLSGTSGGAVCATLAWYSLIKAQQGDSTPLAHRLIHFWKDNSTQTIFEKFYNDSMVNVVANVNRGLLPQWQVSPDSPPARLWHSTSKFMLNRENFLDFKKLLQTHIDFKQIKKWKNPPSPVLMISAANVCQGEFKKFNSLKEIIKVEFILASAAVPFLFPAVHIGDEDYWDGLFSENPPIDDLVRESVVSKRNKPDEIWIIQINPETCDTVPRTTEEIVDRRNEMIGNESLNHELEKIELINEFLAEGAFEGEFRKKYRSIKVAGNRIQMSAMMQKELNYSSKIDRSADHINRLIKDGEKQGRKFLENKGIVPKKRANRRLESV